ncbi:unnamed protein product [Urochloa decumbens]|uniref:F-box domain-containing protein n=1 Tax=Urochloa decumbens TaxID=240449 RepID=A0ABC9CGR2_9POAL
MEAHKRSRDEPTAAAGISEEPKKKTKITSAAFLPDELISEVLLRLPSKSVLRFRSVCRSWNRLVSSAAFDRLYHDRQAAAPPCSADHLTKFAAARSAPPHLWKLCDGVSLHCDHCPRFIGAKPCHRGILLLGRQCAGAYTLCNLSTGGFLGLPPCRTGGYPCTAGIGYDSAAGEYKVVQLDSRMDRPSWEMGLLDCQVLTVGDSRGWRCPASSSLPNNTRLEDMDPVSANGCLHWILDTELLVRDEPQGILSFSLATESFTTVPLPPFFTEDLVPYDTHHPFIGRVRSAKTTDNRMVMQPIGTALAELDGCLGIIRDLRRRRDVDGMFELWKLKERYGSGAAWSLDYRIQLAGSIGRELRETWLVVPICYLPSAASSSSSQEEKRKIVLATTAHDAHVYDPQTSTLEMVASLAVAHDNYSRSNDDHDNLLCMALYQESLVHVPGMEYGAN